jgi:hypothetical protein
MGYENGENNHVPFRGRAVYRDFNLPNRFRSAEESAPPKQAGDESNGVLNHKSSGADPSHSAE